MATMSSSGSSENGENPGIGPAVKRREAAPSVVRCTGFMVYWECMRLEEEEKDGNGKPESADVRQLRARTSLGAGVGLDHLDVFTNFHTMCNLRGGSIVSSG